MLLVASVILPHMDIIKKWIEGPFVTFLLGVDWLDLIGITIFAVVAYWAGSRFIGVIVHRAVKGARHREWHKKDIEKREKTLTNLFRSVWRIVVALAFVYAFLAEFFPNVGAMLAPLFASAGIIGVRTS